MLDNPEKTARLLAALKAAVPFEVDLTPAVVKQLQSEYVANADQIRRIVSDLSYAGDEGGIVCHIVPLDKQEALFISLTHVRMLRTMPLAAAVADYQKHRVKKLRSRATSKSSSSTQSVPQTLRRAVFPIWSPRAPSRRAG